MLCAQWGVYLAKVFRASKRLPHSTVICGALFLRWAPIHSFRSLTPYSLWLAYRCISGTELGEKFLWKVSFFKQSQWNPVSLHPLPKRVLSPRFGVAFGVCLYPVCSLNAFTIGSLGRGNTWLVVALFWTHLLAHLQCVMHDGITDGNAFTWFLLRFALLTLQAPVSRDKIGEHTRNLFDNDSVCLKQEFFGRT